MPVQERRAAQILWQNQLGGGLSLNASGNSGPISVLDYERLGLFIGVTVAPTGTTPTLQVTIFGLDPEANLYQLVQSASINAVGNSQLSVGSGMGASPSLFVPQLIQVNWVLGGTTPVFPAVALTLEGR